MQSNWSIRHHPWNFPKKSPSWLWLKLMYVCQYKQCIVWIYLYICSMCSTSTYLSSKNDSISYVCEPLVQIIGMVAIQNFFCFNRERKVNLNYVGKWLQDLACRTNENEENKRAHRYFKIYERNRIHPMGNRRQ